MNQKLNKKFCIPREQLEDRLHVSLRRDTDGYNNIIPLRDVVKVEDLSFVRIEILESLIKSIPLRREGEKIFPYQAGEIKIFGVEPKGLAVGQTFVSQPKVLSIMSNMGRIFDAYVTKGVSKMPPAQVYGRDNEGQKVLAFYIPPIVEQHNGYQVLLDGIHRSYLCSSAGTTVNAIHIRNISHDLPFDPISWEGVSPVDEKPPIHERYKNLDSSLFRDLGYVGIDG